MIIPRPNERRRLGRRDPHRHRAGGGVAGAVIGFRLPDGKEVDSASVLDMDAELSETGC
jgi:hypothetical protein